VKKIFPEGQNFSVDERKLNHLIIIKNPEPQKKRSLTAMILSLGENVKREEISEENT
jgi:hypothetical protein